MNNIQSILKQIEDLQQALIKAKSECTHTRVIYSYDSNTGNYDPLEDYYWNNITCIDCGKRQKYYSEEDSINYSLVGEVGSELQVKKEEYEQFLKIQKQLGGIV